MEVEEADDDDDDDTTTTTTAAATARRWGGRVTALIVERDVELRRLRRRARALSFTSVVLARFRIGR